MKIRIALLLITSIVNSTLFAQNYNWTVNFRDSSEVLTPRLRRLIEHLTKEAQIELLAIYPEHKGNIKINISIDSVGTIAETGNSGFPISTSEINWIVNSDHKLGLKNIISKYYKNTIYHEFNHIVRDWTSVSSRNSNNFMDAVIAEGMATAFEIQYTKSKPLWSEYPENVEDWVNELMDLPLTAYREYSKWMFEHPDGRKWIGYKAGTFIINKALKLSGKTLVELTKMSTKEILTLAGYED